MHNLLPTLYPELITIRLTGYDCITSHDYRYQLWILFSKCNEHENQGGLEPPELPGDLGDLIPSCASCSRKSDQSSARDSFLVPPSGKKSVERAGVLGVLCHGDNGTRRFGFDAPGRARPACSRCSAIFSE